MPAKRKVSADTMKSRYRGYNILPSYILVGLFAGKVPDDAQG